ncbi:type IV pilus biogenesis protein PilM [Herbaspirillum sp. ST 5-3]|uniref:type IV pilus biogenesis protein PilM n=1 Tax=Oxalobacteraceae TaxID=75682 RepID=UPI0010A41074|nr:type IV pilus biogenesis protein PilM [Herbaspirillum sp. ST 5-3]
MWNVMVAAVLAALMSFYSMQTERNVSTAEQNRSVYQADSMAVYRDAVVRYFTANPAQFGTVSTDALIANNDFPAWSPQAPADLWNNFRANDGTIYIFAAAVSDQLPRPPRNITDDIVRLSRKSVLTGVFRTGDTTLHSPVLGQTNIPLPDAGSVSIPDGSPVWVAMIN